MWLENLETTASKENWNLFIKRPQNYGDTF